MERKEKILQLKKLIFERYDLHIKEDDPAWLMVLIYNDLLSSANTTLKSLEKKQTNNAQIDQISIDNLAKFQSVLENINTLQIEATETVETAFKKADNLSGKIDDKNKDLYTDIKKHHQSLYDAINEQIKQLETDTKTMVANAMNGVNIDTSDLAKVIDEKIAKYDLSKLDHFIKNSNSNIDKAIGSMAQSMTEVEQVDTFLQGSIKSLDKTADKISTKTEEINDAVENINSANKSLSMAMTLAMLFVGIVIGAGVMTYLKIDATSDFYFSQYEEKQVKLKADQEEINNKLKNLDKVSALLLKHGNKISYGIYNNSDVVYIEIENVYSDKTEYTFTRNGSALIGLK